MGFAGVAHRFPTTVVGSLPRPAWLLDRWEEQGDPQVIARRRLDYLPPWYAEARPAEQPKPLGEAEQARLLDQAVPFAIAMQIPCRSEERQRRGTSAVPKSAGAGGNRHGRGSSLRSERRMLGAAHGA